MRFLRLNATDAEHMLYATRLAKAWSWPSSSMPKLHSAPSAPRQTNWCIPSRPCRLKGRQKKNWPKTMMLPLLPSRISFRIYLHPIRKRRDRSSPQRGWMEPNPALPLTFGKSMRFSAATSRPPRSTGSASPARSETEEPNLEELEKTVQSGRLHRK